METNSNISASAADSTPTFELIATTADKIVPKLQGWIWPGFLEEGGVGIFAGPPEELKSTIIRCLAATFSVGGLLPDGAQAPICASMIVPLEESLERTVVPGLILHGADLSNVILYRGLRGPKTNDKTMKPGGLDLRRDLPQIKQLVEAHAIKVIFIDSIAGALGSRGWGNGQQVHQFLSGLKAFAEQLGVTIILVLHTKAGAGGRRALDTLLARPEVAQSIRFAWMITAAPDDERHDVERLGRRRVFGVIKMNNAIKPPALEVSRPPDQPVVWHGVSSYDIDLLATRPTAFTLSGERQAILKEIAKVGHPLSPKMLDQRLPDMSYGAIRKALSLMTTAGQITRIADGYYDDPITPTYPREKCGNTGNSSNNLLPVAEIEAFITKVTQAKADQFDVFGDEE